MTKYQVGDQTFAVIEGELWHKIPPQNVAGGGEPVEAMKTRSIPTKIGKKKLTAKARKGGVDPELKTTIYEEYKAGATIADLAKKYKGRVSYGMVYYCCKNGGATPRLKKNSGEPLKLSVVPQKYICVDGHHFASKLPFSHARCPDCNKPADVQDVDAPVVEETINEEIE